MIGFLYGQTEYNILKSAMRLEDYVNKAKLYGYKSLSITDHNMYGHYKFYNLCLKNGIKPLIGVELYYKSFDDKKDKIIVYALNDTGYMEILKLSSIDKLEGKIFSLEELSKFENVIFISTFESEWYRTNDLNVLYDKYKMLKHFGIGLSFAGQSLLSQSNLLYEFATKNNIKIYPISPTLYDTLEDFDAYEALCLIASEKPMSYFDFHLKNLRDLEDEYFMHEEVFKNYEELVTESSVTIFKVKKSLPKFNTGLNTSSAEYLQSLCQKGLERRYSYSHVADLKKYKERMNYELSVIHSMGYDDYFLIVWDYVRYAKKAGIMVGPGRGSAAGSLVAYCLGITNVDPLRYNLLFERFLNPERVTMPDIDMDFPDNKREDVINYVKSKYGDYRVCTISAFGTFQVKSSIRDIGRALKIKSQDIDIITKLAAKASDFDTFLSDYRENKEIYKLLTVAKKIENLPRTITTHAAGIIISDDDLTNNVPLQKGSTDLYQSQLDSHDLADLGLLKMDFLGITNLAIIDSICSSIPNLNNITIQNIPLDNEHTYELLRKGDTDGIFQLESEGIKKVLVKLKPTSFNDLVAVLALYRPGPMDNIDEFILRKHGKSFSYLHPDLEPILKETYGIIVYQEQIMQICVRFAKMSLAEADILRRAVSKKDKQLLTENREKFVGGAVKNGYEKKVADDIYDYIVKFANYGFNKSHSVAYSIISYHMAYFKANYFALFMAKYLNSVLGNVSVIENKLMYARRRGINVLPPNINVSCEYFVTKGNDLIYPLTGIQQIGFQIAKQIIAERENGSFKSLNDFKERLPQINKNVIEALIYSGAFDSFNVTKKMMLSQSDPLESIFSNELKSELKKISGELSADELRLGERKYLGFNIQYDLFKNMEYLQKQYNAIPFSKRAINYNSRIIVEFLNIKEIKTKKGDYMALGTAFDGKTSLKLVIFPNAYMKIKKMLKTDELYLTTGRLVKSSVTNEYEYQLDDILEKIR